MMKSPISLNLMLPDGCFCFIPEWNISVLWVREMDVHSLSKRGFGQTRSSSGLGCRPLVILKLLSWGSS